MDLHWGVQDAYNLKVDMYEVLFTAEYFAGKVERYADNRARVLVRSKLAEDMKRFVTVKELCHLVIDEQDDWSTMGVDTIKSLLVEWELAANNGDGNPNPSSPLQSEFLAEIAATEFMYPFLYRDQDMAKLEANETDVDKIAFEHEIPAFAVEQALRHHHVFSEVWQSISLAAAAE